MRRRSIGIAAGASLAMAWGSASAQGVDCARLRTQIANVRGNPAQSQRLAQAEQRQQRELDRTLAYAQSIGCENRRFLFFGSAPPAQCDQINPQIARMQANLQRLQQQGAAAGGEAERGVLQAQYNSYCNGGVQAAFQGPRNFFQQLFGGGPSAPTQDVPIAPGPISPTPDESVRGGSKAVCVRICDGGFFPVNYNATRGQYADLQQICDAQCPNTQTELFTYPESGVIDQAVSANGQPYSSLPHAGLFRTHYDPACTCRPPHESWAQALAGASLTGDQRSDIIVTPEKSDQMARAVATSAPKSKKAGSKAKSLSASSSDPATDDETAVDMANSAAGPTVGEESADIGDNGSLAGKTYGENEGRVVEETGPNGVKRRVRIIGP